jgi:murein DD-endopeptidase MepM/ murein hydrolase activator NlpD
VFAVADGVVTFSDGFGVPGRIIALDHGMGLSSLYGSLEQAYVSRGETVRSGQRIGRVGAT